MMMGKGPEAVACGLATHLIPSDQLVALRKDLEVGFGMLWISLYWEGRVPYRSITL